MFKYINYSICFIISISCTLFTYAQNGSSSEPYTGESCGLCKNGKHTNESPYSINFKKEIPYFATGLGLLGTGLAIKNSNEKAPFVIGELDQLDPSKINSFDRGAVYNNSATARKLSNVTLLSGAVMPILFLANHHTKKDFFPLFVMGVEVFTITSTITLNTKFVFNRTRPLAYNPAVPLELRTEKTSKLSFFSGHTAQSAGLSFFFAKVINDYHPNMNTGHKIGLWSFAIALPAVTGYLRVKGGKHFNTDVITGFAVGAFTGWLIPHLHKKKTNQNLSIVPFNYNGSTGLSLSLKL